MCRHCFDQPFILPVENPERGKLQPNYNAEALFHMYDTHGLPTDMFAEWIFQSIYDLPLTGRPIDSESKPESGWTWD